MVVWLTSNVQRWTERVKKPELHLAAWRDGKRFKRTRFASRFDLHPVFLQKGPGPRQAWHGSSAKRNSALFDNDSAGLVATKCVSACDNMDIHCHMFSFACSPEHAHGLSIQFQTHRDWTEASQSLSYTHFQVRWWSRGTLPEASVVTAALNTGDSTKPLNNGTIWGRLC